MENFTEEELLALHEALCFTTTSRDLFRNYIKRNSPPKEWQILDAMGFRDGGSDLIGKVFRMLQGERRYPETIRRANTKNSLCVYCRAKIGLRMQCPGCFVIDPPTTE